MKDPKQSKAGSSWRQQHPCQSGAPWRPGFLLAAILTGVGTGVSAAVLTRILEVVEAIFRGSAMSERGRRGRHPYDHDSAMG